MNKYITQLKSHKCEFCGSDLIFAANEDNYACSNIKCVLANGYNEYLKLIEYLEG